MGRTRVLPQRQPYPWMPATARMPNLQHTAERLSPAQGGRCFYRERARVHSELAGTQGMSWLTHLRSMPHAPTRVMTCCCPVPVCGRTMWWLAGEPSICRPSAARSPASICEHDHLPRGCLRARGAGEATDSRARVRSTCPQLVSELVSAARVRSRRALVAAQAGMPRHGCRRCLRVRRLQCSGRACRRG